jgi:hypothetical protein
VSVQSVRCPCLGKLECKLCGGSKFYPYDVGPRGWMPFPCPTCDGTGALPGDDGGGPRPCVTCHGDRKVDPAYPPLPPGSLGVLRKIWRIFFGGS